MFALVYRNPCVCNRIHHILIAAIVLAAPIFAAGTALAQDFPPPKVRVGPVKQERVQERVQVTGDLRAARSAAVASHEPGLVVAFDVREGDHISAGEPLAKLDDRRLRLTLKVTEAEAEAAHASIREREAELEQAHRDVAINERLVKQSNATQKELDDSKTTALAVEARLLHARRELTVIQQRIALLRLRLEDMTVRAPFDGVAIERHTEKGEWIGEGDPVVTMNSTGALEAWLDVPQRFARSVAAHTGGVSVTVAGAREALNAGSVRIVPRVDTRARTFSLVATISTEGQAFAPGMSAGAWAPAGEEAERLTVPKDAVLRDRANPYLFVARKAPEGGYMAAPAAVRVLFEFEDRVAVESDSLHDGDLVVVEGNERLFPMSPIDPMQESAPAQP